MSFWPHIIFGSPTDLWSSLTFEICMWPHLAMNSGKSMWKNIAAFMQDWNLLLDKLMIGFKNNLWQNVFSFFPFLFFFFPLFYFFFHFVKKKNKKKKADLKVLYRDWHSAWSLVTIAICVQRHRMLVSNRLLPKQFEK